MDRERSFCVERRWVAVDASRMEVEVVEITS